MLKNNIFSLLTAIVILFLSLADLSSYKVPEVKFPGFDKLVHAGMYFGLMLVMIIENGHLGSRGVKMLQLALIPAAYGALLEVLQSTVTVSRTGTVADFLFDLAGIVLAVIAVRIWKLVA